MLQGQYVYYEHWPIEERKVERVHEELQCVQKTADTRTDYKIFNKSLKALSTPKHSKL